MCAELSRISMMNAYIVKEALTLIKSKDLLKIHKFHVCHTTRLMLATAKLTICRSFNLTISSGKVSKSLSARYKALKVAEKQTNNQQKHFKYIFSPIKAAGF